MIKFKAKKWLCPKCALYSNIHCHVYLFCLKVIWGSISFSLICISFGVIGKTNAPTQYIRDTRKLRVPYDRGTSTNSGAFLPGINFIREKHPNIWDVPETNPAQPWWPTNCPLESKGIFLLISLLALYFICFGALLNLNCCEVSPNSDQRPDLQSVYIYLPARISWRLALE